MARPRKHRRVLFSPRVTVFLPQGKRPGLLDLVELTREEAEAVRLKNIRGLQQTEAARMMHTSQSTFQRLLTSAYYKISIGLIHGRGIRIA